LSATRHPRKALSATPTALELAKTFRSVKAELQLSIHKPALFFGEVRARDHRQEVALFDAAAGPYVGDFDDKTADETADLLQATGIQGQGPGQVQHTGP
jgi:hypothetical protein